MSQNDRRSSARNAAVGSVVTLYLVAGCTGAQDAPEVATLRSAAPPPASSPAAAERPFVRPDQGAADFDRYVDVFYRCLIDEGVKVIGTGVKREIKEDARTAAAKRKCDILYPETWMEHERRTNPEFTDLLRETAKCLKEHGHDVTVGGDPISLRYGDNTSANQAYDDEQACQREAFHESVERYRDSAPPTP